MKRSSIFITTLLLFCFFIQSCKDSTEKSSEKGSASQEIQLKENEGIENETELIIDVPSFENSAVQEYVNSYEDYLKEYRQAVEKQDIQALSELGPKGQELSIKAQEISGNMTVEDVQKFTHYMTEKAQEIRELTLNMPQ